MAVQADIALSNSALTARGFADVCARYRARGADAVAEPADFLIGLLLAHGDGEVTALMDHFRLTVRDVLPDDFPAIDPDEFALHTSGAAVRLSDGSSLMLAAAAERRRGETIHVRHLVGELLLFGETALQQRFREGLAATATEASAVADAYREWQDGPDAKDGRDAGPSLRRMLDQQFPRGPIDMPGYMADRVGGGRMRDLVGIRREVDAFAYLLAAKAQRPPLAIGLFGDWGSGKSFFMKAVRERVEQLRRGPTAQGVAESPFWHEIRQIEFNAWEYVRGSLWASLVDHIFRELDGAHVNLVAERREELDEERKAAKALVFCQKLRQLALGIEIRRRRDELKDAERRLDEERKHLGVPSGDAVARHTRALVGEDAAELAVAAGAARDQVARARVLMGAYWTGPRILGVTVVALAVPAIAYALDRADFPAVVSVLGALTALVPVVTTLLRRSSAWLRGELDELAKHDADVIRARDALAASTTKLAEVAAAGAAAQAEADARTQQIERLSPAEVLGEYIQERSRSEDYRSHLGLLGKVRDDLRKLEGLVRDNNLRPGEMSNPPPNRIILYIDDLDRCPSAKVVEVLEAVHLLLAFELFVVVVAVDSRWLSFSLTDELKALEHDTGDDRHRATPQDYVEKIFQLPFWVQPLSPDDRRALAHGLLEPLLPAARMNQDDAARLRAAYVNVGEEHRQQITELLAEGGAQVRADAKILELTHDDLSFIDSLAPLLGDTPRRVKRFVNVTQLLLALPPSLGASSDRAAVAFLAAISSGLPALAPHLFKAIRATPEATLAEVADGLVRAPDDERSRLAAWLREHPAWATRQLGSLHERLEVVGRLSFRRELSLG